ncbi:MAG: 3'-5' exonuclease domain-containing protein 2 [Muribaculaceae bacterium]|nr:3'-5' exonuclease domain-containing protein 2 [Muribaculaceae bacterium]
MVDQANPTLSITKDELAELPMVQYNAGATIIDSIIHLDSAIEHLRNARIIGFDTETRPSFRKGQSFKVSLLQLASPERCFLFRLNKLGLHPLLRELLEDANLLKVGVSLRDDFNSLHKISPLSPAGFVDLQQYVKQFGIIDNSLSRIYAILFGKRISKNQRLTNWEGERLTQAQINYAAFDAISCIQIYDYLEAGNFDPTQSPYQVIPEEENT